MNSADFLRRVWPDEGIYCLATPIPGGKGWRHKTFTDVTLAADWAEAHRAETDIYFSMHTLKAEKHFNETKNKYQVRSHPNMKEARVFFCEIDIGEDPKKYSTQAEALLALKEFCKTTQLPSPIVTSSGRGLHVFWPLDLPLDSDTWKVEAFKLNQLAQHHKLLIDPTKIVDQSAVLRVPGTLHLKDPVNPRPVQVLKDGKVTPTAAFRKLLGDAHIRTGLTPRMLQTGAVSPLRPGTRAPVKSAPVDVVEDYEAQPIDAALALPDVDPNLLPVHRPEPPPMAALTEACAQLKYIADKQGDVSEPEWYFGLIGTVQFVQDGIDWVHKLSSGYPAYSRSETDEKIAQWGMGVSRCETIRDRCGAERCEGCSFKHFNRNPIWAARRLHTAPPPVERYLVGTDTLEVALLDPPEPFRRLAEGGVVVAGINKDGDSVFDTVIPAPYDLYPLRRQVNRSEKTETTEQQVWKAVLPRGEVREFTIEADAIYEKKRLFSALSHSGLYVDSDQHRNVEKYMVAYIRKLQEQVEAETQSTHLGWSDDKQSFILPDRVLTSTNKPRMAVMTASVRSACDSIRVAGTLEEQIELMKFYDHPKYIANQFFILCSLGAPLMRFTEQAGVIVNATGPSGASKSTSLYAAASFWGHPVAYPMSGTATGATALARENRMQILCNLPTCVDEITHMKMDEARTLAMSVSQAGGRIAMKRDRTERSVPATLKSTIMLTTANSSLHTLLSTENVAGNAGSMRVFEIRFEQTKLHTKPEADEFLRGLKENHGHIGPIMAAYYTQHLEETGDRTRQIMRQLDLTGKIAPSERFWSAAAASAMAAAEVANKLGLLPYNVAQINDWLLRMQLPRMRGVVGDAYDSPVETLTDFLAQNNGRIVVTNKGNLRHAPSQGLVAHYETEGQTITVLRSAFRTFCLRTGANFNHVLDELHRARIITARNQKVTLGRGTPFAVAQAACMVLDASHPMIRTEDAKEPAKMSNVLKFVAVD